MSNVRLIARLDIKGPNLIKGVHLEGLRIIGDPQKIALKYYEDGIDELLYMDIVASLYNRNNLHDIVKHTAQNIFVPLTVGGGVRSVDDASLLLRSGADKIAINTAAIKRPKLIEEVADRFGSQCMVLSIEAKKISGGKWEAYIDNGRESTGVDVYEWAKQAEESGAGEILLTSVDNEGTRKGFDIELIKTVSLAVNLPVIASGGMGNVQHLTDVVNEGYADAVAIADVLHYNRLSINDIRKRASDSGLSVRVES
tara:strand:+ start:292 stop:1056 length:765 start_codon:yes stop_codon:yes gene_type:complete